MKLPRTAAANHASTPLSEDRGSDNGSVAVAASIEAKLIDQATNATMGLALHTFAKPDTKTTKAGAR